MLALLIPFVAKKVTDFLGLIQHGRWGAAGRQAAAWAAATLAVVLVARSPQLSAALAGMIDLDLSTADLGVQVAVGIGFGSAGSAFFDLLKARDNTLTSAGPQLFGGDRPPAVVPDPPSGAARDGYRYGAGRARKD